MIATADVVLADVATPREGEEAEYLARFAQADFAPHLLFASYPEPLAATLVDPAAAWKLRNLAATLDD